jgi:ABC-type transport system involved in multi-copper enzyme maturation permease subunit
MTRMAWAQIRAIIRIEMKKTFFAKRGLWIYLLAFAPVALFLTHSLVEIHQHGARRQMALKNSRPLTERDFGAIASGMSRGDVIARLGEPPVSSTRERPGRTGRRSFTIVRVETLRYSNGNDELVLTIENGAVTGIGRISGVSFGQDSYVFAGVFQFFFIRLAIFFGCLGIFMNLFRGEMLDKSLHFYLLTPVRREILMLGKYLAGLLAATVIFSASTALQLLALLLQFDASTITQYLDQNHGISQMAAYLGVTVLACIGYGSIFLAAGLLFRNPIVPAAAVLIWEAANPVLPALLKKISVIYYLKSLCPVEISLDPGMPPLFALLASNPEPVSRYIAIFGLLALSVVVLFAAAKRVRRLEINYGTD